MSRRLLSTTRVLHRGHENPLGLPRSGAPPTFPRMQRGLPEKRKIANVKKVVAVSSAKGGVGKSTIADTDIFGPSIPTLFNLNDAEEPRLSLNNRLMPLTNYGVQTMAMGYLVPPSKAVVWRGLMVMKALQQLLHEVEWNNLDVLVLDMPPGTGDTQLTISQHIELDGAVLISTPQLLALDDTLRGLTMFRTTQIPILGMVQNMSLFTCPHCAQSTSIFGSEGVRRACEKEGIEFLADVPLDKSICEAADRGKPSVVADPEGSAGRVFEGLARRVAMKVGLVV